MAATASPSNAINIHVFRNGDTYYKGRKFVVNQRQTRNFESFLSMVTTGVRPQYGAVRKLYTPTHGHKVDSLSDLENNKYYVAAGMERFRRVQYFSIGRSDGQKHENALNRSVIKPVAHSRIKASAKIRKPADGPKTIHVYRNGDTLYPSVRLLLTKRMLSNWDVVLQIITDRVNLINGAVRRLWHMDGTRVMELTEIDNEGVYVASGNERFKKVAYGMSGPLEPSSPRIRRPAPPAKQKPTLPIPKKTPKISPRGAPKKPAKPKPPPDKKKKKEKTAEQKEAESVFHSRPAVFKKSREKNGSVATSDFEEGENGVFKAKETRKETRGAVEVTETKDTAVDLPIDQVKAEEVDDEVDPESHDQLGNHVTQNVIKQEKDDDTWRDRGTKSVPAEVVVKKEKDDQQLDHIEAMPPGNQVDLTSSLSGSRGNYNNNHRDDSIWNEHQTEHTPLEEADQEIKEEIESDSIEEDVFEGVSILGNGQSDMEKAHDDTAESQDLNVNQSLQQQNGKDPINKNNKVYNVGSGEEEDDRGREDLAEGDVAKDQAQEHDTAQAEKNAEEDRQVDNMQKGSTNEEDGIAGDINFGNDSAIETLSAEEPGDKVDEGRMADDTLVLRKDSKREMDGDSLVAYKGRNESNSATESGVKEMSDEVVEDVPATNANDDVEGITAVEAAKLQRAVSPSFAEERGTLNKEQNGNEKLKFDVGTK